ncbi:MAG: bifunctional folylpolyglutamate synthase/dihydrofolate synthase, partial [bacterium]
GLSYAPVRKNYETSMTYATAINFLNSLINYERTGKPRSRFKLDNIRQLLLLAGNPQEKINKIILIAGTKGKGSVAYMVDAGLRACGLKTGLFISPHLLSVRERIQLNGKWMNKTTFARLVASFQPLVKRHRVSYFELLTAIAFEFFARQQVDYAVIEVGLGGRLDATNLCEPAVSVITRIGYDHVNILGRTLTKIAKEKAGIMRPGKPVIIGLQLPEAKRELLSQAARVGALPILIEQRSRVWDETTGTGTVAFSCFTELGTGRVELKLLGRHQIENCRTALTVLGVVARSDPQVNFDRVTQGWKMLSIPGRCQLVADNPPIIIDSCHNPESGLALAGVLKDYLRYRAVLIYGSLRNKLLLKTLEPIVPYVDSAIAVAPDSPRALSPSVLKGIFTRLKVPAETAPNFLVALNRARELSFGKIPIVIAGSFYLAGAALSLLNQRAADRQSP